MSRLFLSRLWLDGLTAALLLLGFAYWWLGNAVHELAGTAMFLLLFAHNLFNRRWWGGIARTPRVHGGEKTIQWSACVCAGAGGVKVGHWIG